MSIICDECGVVIDPYGCCDCYDRLTGKEIVKEEEEE
jgi:hypothetical protein